jgi:hypothetical protein
VTEHPRTMRRRRALERLTAQLDRGTKPEKRTHPHHNRNVGLSYEDRERIKAEIRQLEKLA